jgi:formylglycine-generating enzyme required for sulfatase activity
MGSEDWRIYGEGGRCEQPQHRVRITVAYYLSTHEVTRGAFQRFVTATGYRTEAERDGLGCNGLDASRGAIVRRPACVWHHPGFEQTAAHPVVCVSWNDARAYCQWLADQTGRSMRLPTEAEWEYACRSGSDSRYSTGESPQSLWGNANLADIALQRVFRGADWAAAWDDGYPFTAPVGLFRPNAFGLYDMHGNVGEWCSDWFDGEYYSQSPIEDPGGPVHARDFHVVRGGSWYNHGLACRAANRHDGVPTARSQTNGFRVAFSADSPEK